MSSVGKQSDSRRSLLRKARTGDCIRIYRFYVSCPDDSPNEQSGDDPRLQFHTGDDTLYLEVIGFWTPAYLAEKLTKVRHVETDAPMLLAVNESLNCTAEDFANANADQVFFYTDRIPVDPVIDRLRELDAQRVR